MDTPCVPYLPPFLAEFQSIAQNERTALELRRIEHRREQYTRWCGEDGQVQADVRQDNVQLEAAQEDDDMVDLERGRREAPLLAQLAAFRAVPYDIQHFGLTSQLAAMDGTALEIWSEEELQLAYDEDRRRVA